MSAILDACSSGYDLLLVYLRLYGLSISEIARELQTYDNSIQRDLQRIQARL